MNTRIEYQLEILHNGVIQVAVDTVYLRDDEKELTRERHRTTLAPGQFKEAETLLDEHNLQIVQAVWTNEVIDLYQHKINLDPATLESGF